jgi:hypothetical protein
MPDFFNILAGIPVNSVLRERVELLKDLYVAKEKEVEDLKQELAQVKKDHKEALKQLADQSKTEQFVEHRGAYFKKNADGEFEKTVYCPKCKQSTFYRMNMFNCTACHWHSPFNESELSSIISKLNSKQ